MVIARGGTIVMLKVRVANDEAASSTRNVKVEVPAVNGVPLINPRISTKSPDGRDPETNDHL